MAAIIVRASSLCRPIVAEGLYDSQQADFLRRQHCDKLDGDPASRPLPTVEVQRRRLQGSI
ncbi:MAG: hypothetical protein V5B60_08525 [Accumulibacter sp.]|jgi:EAL domain-containing protein (putative c-di-GMP-specific phosphodiesterase class I)|uniref:hypothetical protein n=1 Tax=Accumulibacter sp. TaxID=2053492 RepID=UPI002FC2BD97